MPSILEKKDTSAPSVFRPAALLREARRQKGLATVDVPRACILDPDGDIVRRLVQTRRATLFENWACYHTSLYTFALGAETVGIIGCAVGAPFAVLVAEELFASGCGFLISLTSAGQIAPAGSPPYFVVVDRALRDEGTSHHYAPPSAYSEADAGLVSRAAGALAQRRRALPSSAPAGPPTRRFARPPKRSPRRAARAPWWWRWNSAALYAFARATGNDVLCLAHVTNTMAQSGDDFEKGEADGTVTSLRVLEAIVSTRA